MDNPESGGQSKHQRQTSDPDVGEAEVFSLVGESLPKVIEAFEKERPKLDPARRSGVDNLLAGFDGKIDRFLLRE